MEEQIVLLKRSLISSYVLFLLSTLGFFFIYEYFFLKNNFNAYYLLAGLIFLLYTWMVIRNNYSVDRVVHLYFLLSPIYNSYFIITSWNYSVVGFVWVIYLPLGAYVFFSKKEIIYYTMYALIYIIIITILAIYINENISGIHQISDKKKVMFHDIIVYVLNGAVISLAVYYNDKIRNLKILSEAKSKGIDITKLIYSDKEIERNELLFLNIEQTINEKGLYKELDFNLSKLSVVMNVNSGYISKSIRYKGFQNFNTYLNTFRIRHAKKLMESTDYQKMTLLYVYSESGFSSQSTFNRVFKQIEGITPTEYIGNVGELSPQA